MLLLTANELKHLAWVSRAIKKPVGHGIHLLFVLRLLFFFSLSLFFAFRLSPRPYTAIIANFRFVDATCQLPSRAALLSRAHDVYLSVRSGIYRAYEFRRATDLSNYTDRRPLSASAISAMSRVSDAVGGRARRASFKSLSCVFRAEQGKKKREN